MTKPPPVASERNIVAPLYKGGVSTVSRTSDDKEREAWMETATPGKFDVFQKKIYPIIEYLAEKSDHTNHSITEKWIALSDTPKIPMTLGVTWRSAHPTKAKHKAETIDSAISDNVDVVYPHPLHPGTYTKPKCGCLKTSSIFSPQMPMDNESKRSMNEKFVSFDYIEIRQYERLPGCNPSVSRGVPISIGWNVVYVEVIRLDEYEGQLGVSRIKRARNDLRLTQEEREQLLRGEWGYSLREIFIASEKAREIKTKRMQTYKRETDPNFMWLSKFEEMREKSDRKLNSFFRIFTQEDEDIYQLINQTKARRFIAKERDVRCFSKQMEEEKDPFDASLDRKPSRSIDRRLAIKPQERLLDDQRLSLCRRSSLVDGDCNQPTKPQEQLLDDQRLSFRRRSSTADS